ncbi:MAG: hypothetical protein ACYSRZ_05975, partial [Planctomycetota bacterium]
GKSYADIVQNGYVARKTFDRVIRQASSSNTIILNDTGTSIEVYYYASDDSSSIDRYARFYTAGGELKLEDGILDPKETLTIQTVCGDVSSCVFKKLGSSAQMILTLNDGSQRSKVISSAVLHNE